MVAFVTTNTTEWEWERLARVAALAGHSFACASEFETNASRPPEHDAAPDMRRFESESPVPPAIVLTFRRR